MRNINLLLKYLTMSKAIELIDNTGYGEYFCCKDLVNGYSLSVRDDICPITNVFFREIITLHEYKNDYIVDEIDLSEDLYPYL